MSRISEQRDGTVRPARERITIDHRVNPHRRSGANECRHVEPVKSKTLKRGQKILQTTEAIPIFALI